MTGIEPKVYTGSIFGEPRKSESEPSELKVLIPVAGGETLAIDEVPASVACSANVDCGFFAVVAGPVGNGKTVTIQDSGSGGLSVVSDDGSAVVLELGGDTPDSSTVNALVALKTVRMSGVVTLTLAEGPLTLSGGSQAKNGFEESQPYLSGSYPTAEVGVGAPPRKFDYFP